MARNRSFEEEKIREAIMLQFWNKGYESTSLADLEDATSLPRTSLYNAFGDKAELLSISLAYYHDMVDQQFDQAIDAFGLEAVFVVFERLLTTQNTDAQLPKGCLILGVATHSATVNESHLEQVAAYRKMLVEKFKAMLIVGQNEGMIGDEYDCENLAEILTCLLWGVLAAKCLKQTPTEDLFDLKSLRSTIAGWK